MSERRPSRAGRRGFGAPGTGSPGSARSARSARASRREERALRPMDRSMDAKAALDRMARSRVVLIGSATRGSDEFHRERAALTRALITRDGFGAVAVEAGWADAERVDRYVSGHDDDACAERALADLQRFPAWMWRNAVVEEFVAWLRGHNDARRDRAPDVRLRAPAASARPAPPGPGAHRAAGRPPGARDRRRLPRGRRARRQLLRRADRRAVRRAHPHRRAHAVTALD